MIKELSGVFSHGDPLPWWSNTPGKFMTSGNWKIVDGNVRIKITEMPKECAIYLEPSDRPPFNTAVYIEFDLAE